MHSIRMVVWDPLMGWSAGEQREPPPTTPLERLPIPAGKQSRAVLMLNAHGEGGEILVVIPHLPQEIEGGERWRAGGSAGRDRPGCQGQKREHQYRDPSPPQLSAQPPIGGSEPAAAVDHRAAHELASFPSSRICSTSRCRAAISSSENRGFPVR